MLSPPKKSFSLLCKISDGSSDRAQKIGLGEYIACNLLVLQGFLRIGSVIAGITQPLQTQHETFFSHGATNQRGPEVKFKSE